MSSRMNGHPTSRRVSASLLLKTCLQLLRTFGLHLSKRRGQHLLSCRAEAIDREWF
jgi:hypothetical protein